MEERNRLGLSFALLLGPAVISNIVYSMSLDPFLRPLSLTEESLAYQSGGYDPQRIVVEIAWGAGYTGDVTKAEMREFMSHVMYARTGDFAIVFRDTGGETVTADLVVGPNRFGPYPPSDILKAIPPAKAALDMGRRGVEE